MPLEYHPTMKTHCASVLIFLCLFTSTALADPLDPIPKGELIVNISDFRRAPDTRSIPGSENSSADPNFARINVTRNVPDNSGRLFINDLRGPLYVIDGDNLETYLNLQNEFLDLRIGNSFAAGFVSFDFHPDFAQNGKFYTIHTEFADGSTTHFRPPDTDINIQSYSLVYEWQTTNPASNSFSGTRRLLMRIGIPLSGIHGAGDVVFNPLAQSGDADYGMLYITIGDNGLFSLGQLDQLGRLDSVFGTIIRIDPTEDSTDWNGRYGIPSDNPFVDQSGALPEIYAYGFRNPHRITWDESTGAQYVFDIGEKNIEEVNLLSAGAHFGWPEREGTYVISPPPNDGTITSLPETEPDYAYPVAQYDHDDGRAISNGLVYRGSDIPALTGKMIFGDIVKGRIFYADADALENADDDDPATTASIRELRLVNNGATVSLSGDLVENSRVDLRFGPDFNGKPLVTTKMDGWIRQLSSCNQCSVMQAEEATLGGDNPPVVESNHTGFVGTGFVNFMPTDSSLTWTNVDGGPGGSSTLNFRYALGNADRTVNLIVNGTSQPITFEGTQGWTKWSVTTVDTTLRRGVDNRIAIEVTGQDSGNIDEMVVVPSQPLVVFYATPKIPATFGATGDPSSTREGVDNFCRMHLPQEYTDYTVRAFLTVSREDTPENFMELYGIDPDAPVVSDFGDEIKDTWAELMDEGPDMAIQDATGMSDPKFWSQTYADGSVYWRLDSISGHSCEGYTSTTSRKWASSGFANETSYGGQYSRGWIGSNEYWGCQFPQHVLCLAYQE